MKNYQTVRRSPYFPIMHGLSKENRSDHKVGMLNDVDMSSALRLRKQVEQQTGVRPTYTALVIKAISLALRQHPHANRIPIGFWRQRIIQLHDIDMTVAVERDRPGIEQATFAATICNTDKLSVAEISQELHALAKSTAMREMGVVLMTSVGIPRLGTRRLIHRLEQECNLRVLMITDNDTWGYWIYSVLKRGLMAPAFESRYMAIRR